jgi:hypothetical protein
MKCDVCGQEVANSEELKAHQERVHPMSSGDGEMPDMLDRPEAGSDMPETDKVPEPAERRNQ